MDNKSLTYTVLSFTEKDLNNLFKNYPMKGLSKFKRTQALTIYFEYFYNQKSQLDEDGDEIDFRKGLVMELLNGSISKETFIKRFVGNSHLENSLFEFLSTSSRNKYISGALDNGIEIQSARGVRSLKPLKPSVAKSLKPLTLLRSKSTKNKCSNVACPYYYQMNQYH
jgi:hypothetical protein